MLNIWINKYGTVIEPVSTVKYLGVVLDPRLKFSEYANMVIKKCAGRISFLYRHSASLDYNCRRILCNSLIQPYLDYCCTAWYSSLTADLRRKLDVVQRRMVRFILSQDRMSHVDTTDLRKLSWLTIPDRVKFFKLSQVFKIRNGTSPEYLSSSFFPLSHSHGHDTRRRSFNYRVSKELADSPTSFSYTAIKLWNELPQSLQGVASLETFKARLKQHLFSSYWFSRKGRFLNNGTDFNYFGWIF